MEDTEQIAAVSHTAGKALTLMFLTAKHDKDGAEVEGSQIKLNDLLTI